MSNSSNINSSNINSNNESESNLLKPQGCLSQPLPCLNYTTYCTCSVWMSQYFINITFQIDHIITPHLQTTSASSTYRNTVQHSFSLFLSSTRLALKTWLIHWRLMHHLANSALLLTLDTMHSFCTHQTYGVVVAVSSHAKIWGECSTIHSPPALFF